MEATVIHAPHKFERNKKLPKNLKCYVCASLISSSGSSCSICDIPVHKACAVKARKDNCPVLEKELSAALSIPPSIDSKGELPATPFSTTSSTNALSSSSPPNAPSSPNLFANTLEIFFSDGSSKNIPYQPDVLLLVILSQIREEREYDGNYVVYDRAGKVITNYDQTLKKIKTAFPLFFTSVENSLKSGKKARLRHSPKRKKGIAASQDAKGNNPSPQLKNRKSLIQKKAHKKYFGKGIPEEKPTDIEQRHGTMSITVISVSDLANQTSDYKFLYFTLTSLDNLSQRHRSQLLENTATPTWNQTIKFHMPCAYGQWNIKIWAIRKIDSNAADVLLGEADFILKSFKDGDTESKTLVLRKEDIHKKDKKAKRIQIEMLTSENQQLTQEIEDEKRQKEILRSKLEESQKLIAQQHDAHNEEMKNMKTKIQRDVTAKNTSDSSIIAQLQEEIAELKQELQFTKNSLKEAKENQESMKRNYEEQIEFYKSQIEGGKKKPKILLQWAYQDRKLKTGASTITGPTVISESNKNRIEWTPSKSRQNAPGAAGVLNKSSYFVQRIKIDEEEEKKEGLGSTSFTASSGPITDSLTVPRREKKKRIQDVYDFGEVLGTGGSSVVREGTHKESGQKVAIKILENYDNVEDASDEEEAFWAEIEIIKQLDHPCVLNVYDFYEDSEHYYVVLELLAGNELFDQIIEKGCYEEPEAVSIVYQVLLALEHLASKSICHLDLKPENILFTDDSHTRIKLIDFGEASSCKDHKLTGWVGTNNYMAPEMIKHLEYDCKVDMWSLGVVTYIMLCGSFAFDAEDEIELYQDIMEMRYEFRSPEWDDVSDDAKSFVKSLLTGPIERLSASEALRHRWIVQNLPSCHSSVRALGEL